MQKLRGHFQPTCLLRGDFVLVVIEEVAAEQEGELGVVLLLLFRHRLELGSVPRNELRQLVDDRFDFCRHIKSCKEL